MIKVGLTGNIGAGKTTVSRFFDVLGIPIFNSDYRAKQLLNNDKHLKTAVLNLFGNSAYLDGKLNSSYLANLVFNDSKKLNQLNMLVHPVVNRDFSNWCACQKDIPYVIKEAAILFESKTHKDLDKIIAVVAPHDLRLERVVKRSGIKKSDILKRMNNQIEQSKIAELSDFVVVNDEIQLLIPQLLSIHQNILKDI
jgi:dephospho-CoA kinase